MSVRVAKWGNSVGVRLPSAVVEKIGLAPGDELNTEVRGRTIVLVPLRKKPRRYTLKKLLAGINKENLHPEVDAGPDVGREVID